MKLRHAIVAAVALTCLSAAAWAREEIKIVGSSTVYPFTAEVAKRVSEKGIAADIKSTGTRAGFSAFCLGYGDWWPDVTGASRPMTETEKRSCVRRGVDAFTEIRIGFDGIVVASSSAAPPIELTRRELFLALAERLVADGRLVANPHRAWRSVAAHLPDEQIVVYGPPVSSGTRDSFASLALSAGCKQVAANAPVPEDLSELDYCRVLRAAPHYVEAGEDDTQIVQVLKENRSAFGIFGYSYAATNPAAIRAVAIDGVSPTRQTIASGSYPLSRPLFIYVKNNRLAAVPKLRAFLEEYVGDAAIGPRGYLAEVGLVSLSEEELALTRAAVRKLLAGSGPMK
jgi:phosphate transport system substrate-binding protein